MGELSGFEVEFLAKFELIAPVDYSVSAPDTVRGPNWDCQAVLQRGSNEWVNGIEASVPGATVELFTVVSEVAVPGRFLGLIPPTSERVEEIHGRVAFFEGSVYYRDEGSSSWYAPVVLPTRRTKANVVWHNLLDPEFLFHGLVNLVKRIQSDPQRLQRMADKERNWEKQEAVDRASKEEARQQKLAADLRAGLERFRKK